MDGRLIDNKHPYKSTTRVATLKELPMHTQRVKQVCFISKLNERILSMGMALVTKCIVEETILMKL